MVIVYFDTSLLEYESEPGIPPYFLRLVGPIQLYLHWSQKTLVHIADAYPCHINRLLVLLGVQRYNKSVKIYNDILFYKSKCNGFHLRLLLLYP